MGNKFFKLLLITVTIIFFMGIVLSGCSMLQGVASSAEPEYGLVEKAAEGAVPGELEMTGAEAPAVAEEYAEESYVEEEMVDAGESDYATSPTIERKVIKNAYMELEIEKGEFESKLFKITNLAEQNDGFISSTQSYSDSEGNLTSGSIVLRVDHENFNYVIDRLKEMGTVRNISITGQDVTQEYIDLESRLRNLEAQEDILLELMEQSKNVSDSIEVQRELSYVQEEIEVIKGRMNYLDNMVSFSTIEVYLYEPEPIKTTPGWGFLDALKRGFKGAVTVFNGMIVALIVMSPVLVLIAIILIIIWQSIRARNRRRARSKKE